MSQMTVAHELHIIDRPALKAAGDAHLAPLQAYREDIGRFVSVHVRLVERY
jgi:hypothetical protein